MDKKLKMVLLALAALAVVVIADTVTTTVYFNVPSDVSFAVTLPGKAGVASGATADVEFNSSEPTRNKINCTVREGDGESQTDLIPCFNYSNTGNRDLNVTLQFDTALPSGVTVKAGRNNTAWITTCTCSELTLDNCPDDDCVDITDASAVKVANISYGGFAEVWLWADYAAYMGGASNTRVLTHTSQAT